LEWGLESSLVERGWPGKETRRRRGREGKEGRGRKASSWVGHGRAALHLSQIHD
jgi:hypothetical protein